MEDRDFERRNNFIRDSIKILSKRSSVYEYLQQQILQIRDNVKKGSNIAIKRHEVRANPFIIITCMIYEKKVRENYPILMAFLLCIFFIYNVVGFAFFNSYFFTREGLFNIIIVNSSFFVITIVFLFSNLFFYIALRILGFKRTMIICFVGIIIFSFSLEIPMMAVPKYLGDLNKFNVYLIGNYLNEEKGRSLRICVYFLGFFVYGMYYSTYMYLFKYTKTIYRCTFFGLIDIINKSSYFLGGIVTLYFIRSLLVAGIACFVGFFTIIFLDDKEEDSNIISDKKKFDHSQFNKFI